MQGYLKKVLDRFCMAYERFVDGIEEPRGVIGDICLAIIGTDDPVML